jgi:hypothetical protein
MANVLQVTVISTTTRRYEKTRTQIAISIKTIRRIMIIQKTRFGIVVRYGVMMTGDVNWVAIFKVLKNILGIR